MRLSFLFENFQPSAISCPKEINIPFNPPDATTTKDLSNVSKNPSGSATAASNDNANSSKNNDNGDVNGAKNSGEGNSSDVTIVPESRDNGLSGTTLIIIISLGVVCGVMVNLIFFLSFFF